MYISLLLATNQKMKRKKKRKGKNETKTFLLIQGMGRSIDKTVSNKLDVVP